MLLIFIIVFVGIIAVCDLSPLFLTPDLEELLYYEDEEAEIPVEEIEEASEETPAEVSAEVELPAKEAEPVMFNADGLDDGFDDDFGDFEGASGGAGEGASEGTSEEDAGGDFDFDISSIDADAILQGIVQGSEIN